MQGEFEILHLNTYVVPTVPLNVEVGLEEFPKDPPVPLTIVQLPVPTDGVFAAKVTEELQLLWSGPALAEVGEARTVTKALPVLSADCAVQLASERLLIVKVVVEDGLTVTLIGLLLPLKIVPFESVPLHGLTPVTEILNIVLCPLQMVVVPLMFPVGLLIETTTGLIS